MTNKTTQLNSHQNVGILVLLFVTLLWGGTFVIIKGALDDSSAMLFISVRFAIASIIMIPIAIKKRKYFSKESVILGFILGLILFVSFATQTAGLKFTTVTKSGFITGSTVVMIPILQTIIEKRKPTMGTLLGTFIVFVGIVFLSSGGNSIISLFTELGSNFNIGDLLTVACAFTYALYMVYLDVLSKKINFWVLLLMQIFTTTALGFAATFIFDVTNIEPMRIEFTKNLIFALLYTSILATIVTTALQTKFQKRVTPTKAGIVFSFEPIFAATFAFFILGEQMNSFGLIGCVLIFCGLIVSEVYDKVIGNRNVK